MDKDSAITVNDNWNQNHKFIMTYELDKIIEFCSFSYIHSEVVGLNLAKESELWLSCAVLVM